MSEVINLNYVKAESALVRSTYAEEWHSPNAVDQIFSGRSGQTDYYLTRLEFNTMGISFLEVINFKLTFTAYQNDINPYGATAIICSEKIEPIQIYEAQTEEQAKQLAGYIGHANCQDNSFNVSSGTVLTYNFGAIPITGSGTYYVYLKRRLGLVNSPNSTPNGFVSFYNPCYGSQSEKSSIELEYNLKPEYPSSEEATISPKNVDIGTAASAIQQFVITKLDSATDKTFDGIDIKWTYEVYDSSTNKIEVDWITLEKDEAENTSATLKITSRPVGEFVIKVIATWGTGGSEYFLYAQVTTQNKWPYLQDWILGYNLGLASVNGL